MYRSLERVERIIEFSKWKNHSETRKSFQITNEVTKYDI